MSVFSRLLAIILITLLAVAPVQAAENDDAGNPLATLPLRPIGPAITSGRISDFAFYPGGDHEFLAGISSGNLFRTTNGGITWEAIFENEGSYAIGVVELDPNDTKTIWVGTGENNSQRSVAAGDGVYKSTDGGKSWTNMGLKDSGHISQIWINPENSDEVLVASQGPLWSDGGDRGLYRTMDGGDTWERILNIDEHTGIIMDLDADTAEVVGKGAVTLRRDGESVRIESGRTVGLDTLRTTMLELARDLLVTTLMLAGPILIVGLVVGVGVSLFQALTSVQEQTMSLIPKMFAVLGVALLLLAPMLQVLVGYAQRVLQQLNTFGLS